MGVERKCLMNGKEYRKVLARNIKRIAYENHKTQADIVRDLGLKQTTVSTWMSFLDLFIPFWK